MSFKPISTSNISESLLGAGASLNALDTARIEEHPHISKPHSAGVGTIIIVIISALVFVTVIAFFDVFHSIISNYYARRALFNPRSFNRSSDISRTLISNNEGLHSDITFSLFCVIVVPILIYLLLSYRKS